MVVSYQLHKPTKSSFIVPIINFTTEIMMNLKRLNSKSWFWLLCKSYEDHKVNNLTFFVRQADYCPLPNFLERRSRSRSFTFFGAALALPLSYFFQSGARAHILLKKSAALLALSFQSNFENEYPLEFLKNANILLNFFCKQKNMQNWQFLLKNRTKIGQNSQEKEKIFEKYQKNAII